MEVKIKNNNEMIDATIEMVEGVMVVSPKEVKFEPKDGDVVYSEGYRAFVFVYKDNLTTEAYFYAALSIEDNKIEFPDGGHIGYVSQLRPATEEEKKLLFDKLAEEGLAWNAERKEFVKLKWKPKEGEFIYYPSFKSAALSFKADYTYFNKGRDNDLLERGWGFQTEQECQEFCNRLNEAINQVKP